MAPKPKPKNEKKSKRKTKTEDEVITTSDSEHEEKISKKVKKEDDLEMIAIIYEIENDKHPFHFLNQVPGSVDIIKILEPLEKHELLQGTRISFVHEHEKKHLIVNATIQCSKIFKVPKTKTGKLKETNGLGFNSVEKAISSLNENLFRLNSNILKLNEDQKEIKDILSCERTEIQSKKVFSEVPRTSSSTNEFSLQCRKSLETVINNESIVNNKEFTNFLRCELESRFNDDTNQTLAYYQSKYPRQILEIKNELLKYVPKNSSFKEAWEKAANSIKMAKCSKK